VAPNFQKEVSGLGKFLGMIKQILGRLPRKPSKSADNNEVGSTAPGGNGGLGSTGAGGGSGPHSNVSNNASASVPRELCLCGQPLKPFWASDEGIQKSYFKLRFYTMTRGSQRDRDRERAAARTAKSGKNKDDGLTPEQRRERDAKALQEKAAKKAAAESGGKDAGNSNAKTKK